MMTEEVFDDNELECPFCCGYNVIEDATHNRCLDCRMWWDL